MTSTSFVISQIFLEKMVIVDETASKTPSKGLIELIRRGLLLGNSG
jgi:hypothetical protein